MHWDEKVKRMEECSNLVERCWSMFMLKYVDVWGLSYHQRPYWCAWPVMLPEVCSYPWTLMLQGSCLGSRFCCSFHSQCYCRRLYGCPWSMLLLGSHVWIHGCATTRGHVEICGGFCCHQKTFRYLLFVLLSESTLSSMG